MKEFEKRLKKLNVLEEKCDAVLIANTDSNDPNFYYYTGCDASYSIFLYDFSKPVIITNKMELPKVKREIKINATIVSDVKILDGLKNRRIGINARYLPYAFLKKFKKTDISQHLENIRSVKSKWEIEKIEKASITSVRILKKLKIKPGMKESEIRKSVEIGILKNDCHPVESIVSSDRNTSVPHGLENDRKISKKDIVMIDVVCRYKKYHSDFTKMFFIGKINKKIKQYYERLKNILKETEDIIQPEMRTGDIDEFVRKKLGKLSNHFIHSTGHGVGLIPHEKPLISKNSKDILKENMVFTLEPALYFKNYGLRIENTYLLTKKGVKIMGW